MAVDILASKAPDGTLTIDPAAKTAGLTVAGVLAGGTVMKKPKHKILASVLGGFAGYVASKFLVK